MNQQYTENGYFVVKRLFEESELQELSEVVFQFHESWKHKNTEAYSQTAVNSAYLTGTEYLNETQRNVLFKFIGSSKLMNLVTDVIPLHPAFMNTQLFFNPVNSEQKNYWHRDPQYQLSLDDQKEALAGPEVVHFRIPLVNEPGIELIPGTHKRWDSNEELNVRMENNGCKNHDDISSSVSIKLDMGDLLVFSANMIHRGLYGMDRLSLDIVFCDSEPSLIKFVNDECLPDPKILKNIEDPSAFLNTMNMKTIANA